MSKIQVSAKMKINPGMLEEFNQQAAKCLSTAKDKDPGTLQYDWFISSDKTECEIRETYENSEAFLAHVSNLREPLRILFEKFASDHSVVIYGKPSPELLENAKARRIEVKVFSLLQGLNHME
jgi:quinol monooxygenase YgiN